MATAPVTVTLIELVGDRVRLTLDGAPSMEAEVTPAAVADLGIAVGNQGWASVKATEIDTYRR